MKKILPAILFMACAAIVAAGLYGVSQSHKNQYSDNKNSIHSPKDVSHTTDSEVGTDMNHSEITGDMKLLDVRMPSTVPDQRKDYEGFSVSFNEDNHTPNWVAWELLATEAVGAEERYKNFWQDSEIAGCPTANDYKNSGYDRGHMCPAADQKWSHTAMVDCFSLANIVPQNNSLNTGAWQTLESKERLWAKRDSAILIVAGPIYNDSDRERIGANGVRVPGAFFKVFAAPWTEKPRGIAFVYPNMTSPGNMENYVMTIRDVEKLTGFDFFHEMPDDIEDKIETVASFRDWNGR